MDAIVSLQDHGFVVIRRVGRCHCLFQFHLKNFRPYATHAIHIHEYGDTSDGCKTLGGHYNPTRQAHGHLGGPHRHKGDLFNNFKTNAKGNFQFEYLEEDLDTDELWGRSLVIHELVDDLGLGGLNGVAYEDMSDHELFRLCRERDYKNVRSRQACLDKLNKESLITGNAGRRLVCGIIGRKNPNT